MTISTFRWVHAIGGMAIVLMFLLVGCGGNPNLSSVTGTITLDGDPLPNAFVKFVPTSGGTTSFGKTDAQGRYEMMFSDAEMGAWQGENRIEIRTGDVGAGPGEGAKEVVPAVYNVESTLLRVVEPGGNVFDFDLNSSEGEIQQPQSE